MDSRATPPWGATPADWQALERLGLTRDLLPVVSDPAGKISPLSKMQGKGKTPSRFNGQGFVVGIPQWPQHEATDRLVGRWSQDSRLGACIQTRRIKAFDIDIGDPVHSRAVRDVLELTLGRLPVRGRSNSGKQLLAFELAVDFPKRVIKTAHGNIELLSTGQQFVAIGAHFDSKGEPSGARYEWEGGLPTAMPKLTMAEVDVAWQALADAFALPDGASEARRGLLSARPRNADDLRDPTVAWLDANGWVTSYERDGKVFVRCPWEDGHSIDSGISSTSWLPAGVGDFQQGHFKCLHASCSKRTDGDFLEAVGYVADAFEVVEAVANATEPLPPFARDRTGAPKATLANVMMAVRRPDVCGARIGFDTFKDALLIGYGDTWRPFTDNDYTVLRLRLETRSFQPIGADRMREVVHAVAIEHSFDSAIQWAEGLEWDGVERVATFYSDRFSVEASAYARAVALYTWTALAGRCLQPGVKADMVPVFIGLQGAGKTTAVESLCPIDEAFAELDLTRKDDDLARQLRGKLVGELAELRGLQTRDAEAIKAWVSRRIEEWTPKYREHGTRYARRLVLFGTGNKDGFLDDETGERRWLPMGVGAVDVDGIRADRDQLWAEGVHLFRQHGVLWREAQDLAQAEHERFKVRDPWHDRLAAWLAGDDFEGPRAGQPVLQSDAMLAGLGLKAADQSRVAGGRVNKILAQLGYQYGNRRWNGRQVKAWWPAENHERAENSAFADIA